MSSFYFSFSFKIESFSYSAIAQGEACVEMPVRVASVASVAPFVASFYHSLFDNVHYTACHFSPK
jgi:hypothetical protein